MTRGHYFDDDPGQIAEREEAQDADRCAAGEFPCAGVCGGWIRPEQVVISDGTLGWGPCCAVIGAKVDADMIGAVCRTILERGGVLGRRVSVTNSDLYPWVVVTRDSRVAFAAHDVFEVARWYCGVESGEWEVDLTAPTYVLPTDAQQARNVFLDRYAHLLPKEPA